MSNPSETKCPRCAAPLPPSAPEGLCPRCLGALNLATDTVLTGADAVAAQPPLTPAELAPHFPQLEIIECLGRGGMGVVYRVRQKALNRLAALKLLAPERVTDAGFAERFTREAQALARLNHPNIVTIYDFGFARASDLQSPPLSTLNPQLSTSSSGFYFLLMEFVDGVNLRQAMRAGRFTPEQALAIVPPVCEALQYAHEQGIVHRDIKPENLLLDKAGRVKIADFGIAKMLGTDGARLWSETQPQEAGQPAAAGPADTATLQHTAAGTPQYMAPEQRTAPQRTDHRADIYSLGVVLYELLTGELPGAKLQPPSRKVQIDVRLDEVVLRALETKPELRFATAAEFRSQVENLTGPTPPASTLEQAQSGEPAWFKLVGLLYVLVGLLGWLPTVASLGTHLVARHAVVMLSATGLALLTRHRWWRWLAIGTNTFAIANYLFGHALILGLASLDRMPSGSPWPNDMGGVAREMARHAPDNLLFLAGFGCGIWLLFRGDARAAFASQRFTQREHNVIGGLAVAALVGGLLPFAWPQHLVVNPYAYLVKAGGVFGLAAWCLLRGGTAAAPLRLSHASGIPGRVLAAIVSLGLALCVGFLVFAGLYRSREATMMAQRAALAAKQRAQDARGSHDPSVGAPPTNAPNVSPITSSIVGGDNSPAAIAAAQKQGIATATEDIQAGVFRILAYGDLRPASPDDKDEETGFRIQWVAGSILGNAFRAEADAYNFAMREWFWKNRPATPGTKPTAVTIPQHIEFKALRVENPPGTRDILLHFERDTNYGLALEVSQDVTPSPGLRNQPQPGHRTWQQTTWVGVRDRVLGWTLPQEFTAAEVRAVVKDMERQTKTMRQLPDGAVPEFATAIHRDGWKYHLIARVKREPGLPSAPPTSGPAAATASSNATATRTLALRHKLASSMVDDLRQILLGRPGHEAKPSADNQQVLLTAPPDVLARAQTFITVTDWPDPLRNQATGEHLRDTVLRTARSFFHACALEDSTEAVAKLLSPHVLAQLKGDTKSTHYENYSLGGVPDPEWEKSLRADWPGKQEAIQRFVREWNRHPLKRITEDSGVALGFGVKHFCTAAFEGAPKEFYQVTIEPDRTKPRGSDERLFSFSSLPPWWTNSTRVVAGQPQAAPVQVATREGKYDLASGATLVITAKPSPRGAGAKHFDGRLDWPKFATSPKAESFDVTLSEGAPFAVGWRADGKVLWVACGGNIGTSETGRFIRKLTINGPGDVDEQSWDAREKHDFGGLPAELRRVFDAFIAPATNAPPSATSRKF